MRVSRRNWLLGSAAGASVTALLAALGVRPRFSHGFSVAGKGKQTGNAPPNAAARLERSAIRCLVLGDWGSGNALQRQVAEGMQSFAGRIHPQFVISTGDNFYPGGVSSPQDPLFQTIFEEVYTGVDLQVPWYCALGNHDYQGSVDSQIAYSARSSRWRVPARYFRFTQSEESVSADFFVLDTENLLPGTGGTQLEWLSGELQSSEADWKICVGHHPIRSSGHYGDTPALLENLKPILDRQGVVAYLCVHDHDVQLSKCPDDRFVCLVSGGGGKARDASYGEGTLFARTNGGFAALALSKSEMTVAILDPQGQIEYVEHCLELERPAATP